MNNSPQKNSVTVASDGMDAERKSNLVPPDSPLRGDLFTLTTTVASDGDLTIKKTLVQQGVKENSHLDGEMEPSAGLEKPGETQETSIKTDDIQAVESAPPVHAASLEAPDDQNTHEEPQSKDDKNNVDVIPAFESAPSVHAAPPEPADSGADAQTTSKETEPDESPTKTDGLQAAETAPPVHAAPPSTPTVQGVPPTPLQTVNEDIRAAQNALSQGKEDMGASESPASKVDEVSHGSIEMGTPEKARALVNEVLSGEQVAKKTSSPTTPEKRQSMNTPSPTKSQEPANVKRTHTMPAVKNLTLPWQKKHHDAPKESGGVSATKQHSEQQSSSSSVSTNKKGTPFGGMMKSLRKSIQKHTPGGSKGGEPTQKRIPQKSNPARPSPRIVSSLHISPSQIGQATTPNEETLEEQDTPITRRRRLMDEIEEDLCKALPPSSPPASKKTEGDPQNGIYANGEIIEEHEHDKRPVVEEEAISPTKTKKDVFASAIMQNQAKTFMSSIEAVPAEPNVVNHEKPPSTPPPRPRQPPKASLSVDIQEADVVKVKMNDVQHAAAPPPPPTATPIADQTLPPRPKQPIGGLRSSYIKASHDETVAAAPMIREPSIDMSQDNWYDKTKSLDRRKLYRSRTETKALKRATLARPVTIVGTVFTPVENPKYLESKEDGSMRKKIVYKRTDSLQIPKFLTLKRTSTKHADTIDQTGKSIHSLSNTSAHEAGSLKTADQPQDIIVQQEQSQQQHSIPPRNSEEHNERWIFKSVDNPKYQQPKRDGTMRRKLVFEKTESISLPFLKQSSHVNAAKGSPPSHRGSRLSDHDTIQLQATPQLHSQPVQNDESAPAVEETRMTSALVQASLTQIPRPLTTNRPGDEGPPTLLVLSKSRSLRRPITPFQQVFYSKFLDISCDPGRLVQEELAVEHSVPFISEQLKRQMTKTLGNSGLDGAAMNDSRAAMLAIYPWVSTWGDSGLKGTNTSTDEEAKLPKQCEMDCLREYLASCTRLHSADIQGEFSAFHSVCSDLQRSGWSVSGHLEGYPSLLVVHDPIKETNYIQMPRMAGSADSMVYPDRTVEEMLTSWLQNGSTKISLTNPQMAVETILHPASAIICLADVVLQTEKSLPMGLLPDCVSLAVLLSFEYCLEQSKSLAIDTNPVHILLVFSPANCLVIFKSKLSSTDKQETNATSHEDILCLLGLLGISGCDSIKEGIQKCRNTLLQQATKDLERLTMPAVLLKALVPPDWTVVAVARTKLCGDDGVGDSS